MKEVKTGVPTFGTFFPKNPMQENFHPESDDRNGLNSSHTLLLLLFVCTPAKQCECADCQSTVLVFHKKNPVFIAVKTDCFAQNLIVWIQ